MKRYLQETWELFYWALWCPSRLQQRMNEWAPAEEKDGVRPDTRFVDILLGRFNRRFFSQFFLIIFCFSLSIILEILQYPQTLAWLLILISWVISYGIALLYLPLAFPIPILLVFSYQVLPYYYSSAGGVIFMVLLSMVLTGQAGAGLFSFDATKLFVPFMAVVTTVIISDSTSWFISGSLAYLLIAVVAENIAFGFRGLLGGIIIGGVSIIMAVVIASIAVFPLPLFCVAAALIGLSLSKAWGRFGGLWLVLIMLSLTTELQTTNEGIYAVSAVCYYRFFPDQILFSFILWINRFFRVQSHCNLQKLPPYTSELIWLPLPGHAQLLMDAFQKNSHTALPIFQHIQRFDLYGFQQTIHNALPQILADQLLAIQATADLQSVGSDHHPLFPQLVPSLYQLEGNTTAIKMPLDVAVMFPKFQTLARDVSNSLEASNLALRERSLERLLNDLKVLPSQLPGLGLRSPMIRRWQPVITHWQRLLELELQAQQRQSQGELPNPFTFGNPLRDRAELFKGRRRFVDEVYRLVLDRNRPTLVLHGPRRCGKSSFLLNLQRLLPSDLIPVYVDLQASGMTNSEADFCYGLLRAIVRDCRSQGISLMALPQRTEFYEAPYPLLEEWLEDALPVLGQRRLLLTLDELGTALTERRLSVRLLDELRSLIQHQERLAFLFSGVQTLAELGPNWSSYFISVVPMEMLYLEPQEAEALMLNPDPDFDLRYDTGILAEILHLTRCQPYLLQLLGSAMVTQANLAHTQRVTFPLLQAAIEMSLTQGDPYFTNVWTEFTGTTTAEVLAGQAYLQSLASDRPPPDLSQPDTQNAIRRLRRYHVIETIEGNEENDRIEIPLIETWVRERSMLG